MSREPRDKARVASRRTAPFAWIALIGGGVGSGAILVLWPDAFASGYLAGYVVVLGCPLGCLAVLMLRSLVGGRWGDTVRPFAESALRGLPILALTFIPVLLLVPALYPWAGESSQQAHGYRPGYLNVPFFLVRAVFFHACWIAGGIALLRYRSGRTEQSEAVLRRISAGGLIGYALTVSFAAIDWLGSLVPEWYSTIFGAYIFIGFTLTALAVLIWIVTARELAPDSKVLNDLGNLLLTLVALHAYIGYSQFFIIWNGNLPEEIAWYLPRIEGGWGTVALLLIGLHFALPLAALLHRGVKQRARWLRGVATVVLAGRVLEAIWMVVPTAQVGAGPAVLGAAGTVLFLSGLTAVVVTRRDQAEAVGP